jgi:hypothetical protein
MKNEKSVLNLKRSLTLSLAATALLSVGCSKVSEVKRSQVSSNIVRSGQGAVDTTIGDQKIQMQVLSASLLAENIKSGKILAPTSLKAKKILSQAPQGMETIEKSLEAKTEAQIDQSDSLLVALPIGLVGEQNIFGGVITKITDKTNQTLGSLKLTDLTPIHVRTFVTGVSQGQPALTLFGCVAKCTEDSVQSPLLSIPVVGVDEDSKSVILDLAPIGKELDLLTMLDGDGEYTGLKAISSAATLMDYSVSTLVFDIKSTFVPKDQLEDPNAIKTDVTVRWYLKLNSAADPMFAARPARDEVGFFKTERSAEAKITRFAYSSPVNGPVKYYIKQVPAEYRKSFAEAIESWNVKFKSIIGKNLLSYEFIEKDDPRNNDLVAGDIRYNIIEWDLDNKASYGGLGPSIANQFTGQTMSANVLVQGPTIVSLYSQWFKANEAAEELESEGKSQEAQKLLANFNKKVANIISERKQIKFSLKLGKSLVFNVRSQGAELEDPMTKGTFEKVPAGYTFEKYMHGYFLEMVAHELGHNLGLRHNFKGNLISDQSGSEGSTSNSIMEYLGREYRYLNRISAYDVMAMQYGYKGIKPNHADWFCTDENVATDDVELFFQSPECSKGDATNDPFSYYENRLARGIDKLVNSKSTAAPIWKLAEMPQVNEAINGLAAYAASAAMTGDSWTNFFGKEGRPSSKSEVKSYVLASLKKQLCNKELSDIIGAKESPEAQAEALRNINELKATIAVRAQMLNLFSAQDLDCSLE